MTCTFVLTIPFPSCYRGTEASHIDWRSLLRRHIPPDYHLFINIYLSNDREQNHIFIPWKVFGAISFLHFPFDVPLCKRCLLKSMHRNNSKTVWPLLWEFAKCCTYLIYSSITYVFNVVTLNLKFWEPYYVTSFSNLKSESNTFPVPQFPYATNLFLRFKPVNMPGYPS